MSRTPQQALAHLSRAFPRQTIPPDTFEVFMGALADLPGELLDAAVEELIRTSEFFPSVRAIRETAAERALELPGEERALAQVEARLAWARLDEGTREASALPHVHDLVLRSVRAVGGFSAFRTTDKTAVVHGQFVRVYRELRAQTIRDAQVGRLQLEAPREALCP